MVLLVRHYTTTFAGVGKIVAGGENRSWPSVSAESFDSECWFLNNAIFYVFIMRLTVEERVFILENYFKKMSYAYSRQSFFQKLKF
jgi:hypothetical protein